MPQPAAVMLGSLAAFTSRELSRLSLAPGASPGRGLRQVVPAGVRTLEVRWILAGELDPAVADWFARFPAGTESRQDSYLVRPCLPTLGVKVRGGGPLEMKVYLGSPGILRIPGGVCGRMERWRKWSARPARPRSGGYYLHGWTAVRKSRRITRFAPDSRGALETGQVLNEGPGCAVELTEIHALCQRWWSLGLEATGPSGLLRSQLEAAAAHVFAEPLPDGVELGPGNSQSYARWLARLSGVAGSRGPREAGGWIP